jgi:mono/diheme cytochrome c family protein
LVTKRFGWTLAVAAACVVGGLGHAEDIARGRAIYETRCVGCHSTSVHNRESRKAKDFAALRVTVVQFAAEAGGVWQRDEIDDVTAYLNQLYYRYPCPPEVCRGGKQAALPLY